jgi:steroid delta-isomerase-like uncharacterized protein
LGGGVATPAIDSTTRDANLVRGGTSPPATQFVTSADQRYIRNHRKERIMSPQATAVSPQALIQAATAPILAYNEKNWDKVKASVTPTFIYDEVPTQRLVRGADQAIAIWKGWADAFPDSRATVHSATATGSTVVLEVTWQGTHNRPLATPTGSIPASNKPIQIRACLVTELNGEMVSQQRHYFDMATLLRQIGALPSG